MEEILYYRLKNICNKIVEKQIHKIYLYPFGNRGGAIFRFIKERYNFQEIILVDNELNRFNPRVIKFEEMEKTIQSESAIMLLTSDNPKIYRELRINVSKRIPSDKVVDCFEENPLAYANDRRLAALALASKQIYINQIEGCVAEVGVYQGDFAKHINILFPDRKLFLFDTFQGFESMQVDSEMDNMEQTDQWINSLKDTAVDIVLEKMQFRNQVIVKKGVFPKTAENIEEKFAFVNLDVDIYLPTYEGLLFFWEKLSAGGYIFVHDFDNWDGIRTAVIKFCKEKNTSYVCLNDGITVCISKPMDREKL